MTTKSSDVEKLYQEMPLGYRIFTKLLLKLPSPKIPFFILQRFPLIEGILHGLMMPIFMYLVGVITLWLLVTTTIVVGFPLNIIIVLIPPTVIFAIYVRNQLERAITWWRSTFGSPIKWDSSKSISELIELFKDQQKKAKTD